MQKSTPARPVTDKLLLALSCLIIATAGYQYAFYNIFSVFSVWDDEGTMLLRVWGFINEPSNYEQISGIYGPLYYLTKRAIFGLIDSGVSHDANRLTTVAFWLLIALVGALFVYRLTKSTVLTAATQFQLTLLLWPLILEPGHPHELGLLLVFISLYLSTYLETRQGRRAVPMGLGAAIGALLLVKINLGIFLLVPCALAVLFSIPADRLVRSLVWPASLAAVLLPTLLMWRHLQYSSVFHYCFLITSAVFTSLLVASRGDTQRALAWSNVATACATTGATIIAVFLIIIYLGSTFEAIANSVIVRPLLIPSQVVLVPAQLSSNIVPVTQGVLYAGTGSILLALGYRYLPGTVGSHASWDTALAVLKAVLAFAALEQLYLDAGSMLENAVIVPFLWLVFALPGGGAAIGFGRFFPRILLAFLAAFQALQAYPVGGSQRIWAVLLLLPAAIVMLSDSLPVIWEAVQKHVPQRWSMLSLPRYRLAASLILLGIVGYVYFQKMDLPQLKSRYSGLVPLDFQGASLLRLPEARQGSLRRLVERTKRDCDGFVGLPGFASLYFWTGIAPPGIINNAWIINLEDSIQHRIIDRMESYDRPCVVLSDAHVKFWTKGQSLDATKPLVGYILSRYKPVAEFGMYQLMQKDPRNLTAED